jgi:hypothetical protein
MQFTNCIYYQDCQNRTGRSDRSNRKPDLHPIRLGLETGQRTNQGKTARTGKTGRSRRFTS